MHSAFKGLNLQ